MTVLVLAMGHLEDAEEDEMAVDVLRAFAIEMVAVSVMHVAPLLF